MVRRPLFRFDARPGSRARFHQNVPADQDALTRPPRLIYLVPSFWPLPDGYRPLFPPRYRHIGSMLSPFREGREFVISNERRIDARVISIRMLTSEETNLLTIDEICVSNGESGSIFFFYRKSMPVLAKNNWPRSNHSKKTISNKVLTELTKLLILL